MKILVVDDHAYNRELLGFILEDHNYEAIYAENGKQALETVLSDTSIALVLMDVMMPVMDGIEATLEIKKHCEDRFLPVLFVTALDDEKNITNCLNAGGDDFVPKPVSESILVAKLQAHKRTKAIYDQVKKVNEELTYHRQLVDREHSIVEHIFENASKRLQTECDNLAIYTSPMSMFNGDLVLSSPSPSGGLYLLVGDFTGHGLAASIGTLPVTEIFFQLVKEQASVGYVATQMNQRLSMLLPCNMFFCAAIAELDHSGKNLTLWLGGMNDVLCKKAGKSVHSISSRHMPLGILSDEEFDDSPELIEMQQGDRLYVYTDGVTEALNTYGEEYGQERLEAFIQSADGDALESIIASVYDFSAQGEQTDDVSIVELYSSELIHRDKGSGEIVEIGADYHSLDSIPWSLSLHLADEDLKRCDVVSQLMAVLSAIKGIEAHQDKVFTIVSELYNNALEHGVLGLDSSMKSDAEGFERYYKLRQEKLENLDGEYIDIRFAFIRAQPNRIELEIIDSGSGFDIEALQHRPGQEEQSHGRGVSLLQQLCSSIQYSSGGRQVNACYDFV
ncbi:SpoIIE family protein phosphatase [Agaribacterium sp. ZY112]|uniref:ATP-binding SpoIIE family protein phosphatase n=1 Tax=Agaribacterium sp. ZY112 TaxID=3233574 RepID=UPI003525469E